MLFLWLEKEDPMKYMICFAAVFLTLIPHNLRAQTDLKIRKGDFKKEREGFKEAWKHLEEGNKYFLEEGVWYGNAYDEYLRATAYNGENAELNYKTGVSALFSDKKDEAAPFLIKALELKENITDERILCTGRA